jgi:hypothetical protein
MATGDQVDMLGRLKAVLPGRWFGSETPILDGILSGFAWALAWMFALIQGVSAQLRLLTATGVGLDIISADFFGATMQRKPGEADEGFRKRLKSALFLPRATRPAMVAALVALTGRAPRIFEPRRPADTGGWGHPGMTAGPGLAYGLAGGWGNLSLPAQVFITAYRPTGGGVANVAGYGGNGFFRMPGGYGMGAIEYASLADVEGEVTDQDILDTINATRPAGTIAWTNISA